MAKFECGAGGVGYDQPLWQITRYNSKTVQNRRIFSIKVELEVICAVSNSYVANDRR